MPFVCRSMYKKKIKVNKARIAILLYLVCEEMMHYAMMPAINPIAFTPCIFRGNAMSA